VYAALGLADAVADAWLPALEAFFATYAPTPVPCIHGDFWLHNVIWASDGVARAIDMRGALGAEHALGGDLAYDYGKLCQSLLGFDALLLRPDVPAPFTLGGGGAAGADAQRRLRVVRQRAAPLRWSDVRVVTFALVLGALPFHPELRTDAGRTRAFVEAVAAWAWAWTPDEDDA